MKLVHRGEVRSLTFSPDVSTLAVAVTRGKVSGLGALLARPGEVHLWDLPTGRRRRVLKQSSGVHAVAFSGDGRTVATGGIDGSLKLWEVSP